MTSPNPILRKTAVMLERAGKDAPIWRDAAEALTRPALTKVQVNVGRISRIASEGGAVFVPGKVLGGGMIDKKVAVGAYAFSQSARAKILAAGGSALDATEFLGKHPKGSGVKLVE